jgi:hypothetical protein
MNQSDSKSEQFSITPALKPLFLSTLILISGIVIGAGLTLIITGHSNVQKSLPPAPEYMSGRMVKRIAEELKLPPEQREQLEPIVKKHMKAMDDIRQDARPKIMDEIRQMNDEIMAILDTGQQQLWQEKMKHMQEHFTRMRNRRDTNGGWRDGRGPKSERRRGDRFHENRPPEGQLPPEERPPIDDMPPPAL